MSALLQYTSPPWGNRVVPSERRERILKVCFFHSPPGEGIFSLGLGLFGKERRRRGGLVGVPAAVPPRKILVDVFVPRLGVDCGRAATDSQDII